MRDFGERGNELGSRVAPYGLADGLLGWLDNRNALGLAAVTFTPTGATPTVAQQAVGITLRNQTSSHDHSGCPPFCSISRTTALFQLGRHLPDRFL